MKKINLLLFSAAVIAFASCHKNEADIPDRNEKTESSRLYVLNQGTWGSENSSLDFLDLTEGHYYSNFYDSANAAALGDQGQDLLVYGSKLYISVNSSNAIKVVDVHTGILLGSIDITSPRYLLALNGKVYVTAYNTDYNNPSINGTLSQIDTSLLTVTKTKEVGRQPEGIATVNNLIYVANSGGYGSYESSVYVIDPSTFDIRKTINVAVNLQKIKVDGENHIYVSSAGNYTSIAPNIYIIDALTSQVTDTLDIAGNNFDIVNDTAYFINENASGSFIKYDCRRQQIVADNFISDGSAADILLPYGIYVHPTSGDIFIADALSYSGVAGKVYQYGQNGQLKNTFTAGFYPSAMALLP